MRDHLNVTHIRKLLLKPSTDVRLLCRHDGELLVSDTHFMCSLPESSLVFDSRALWAELPTEEGQVWAREGNTSNRPRYNNATAKWVEWCATAATPLVCSEYAHIAYDGQITRIFVLPDGKRTFVAECYTSILKFPPCDYEWRATGGQHQAIVAFRDGKALVIIMPKAADFFVSEELGLVMETDIE